MKLVLPKIIAAVFVATALGACSSKQDTSDVSGSVQVLAPMNDSNGGYSLQFVNLLDLNNLREVSGRFVRFFMSPRIISDHLNGPAPQGRFIKNVDGKYVPANDLSQQLVTVYAHMQKLAQLDDELGAAGVNHWPRDIGVAVKVVGGMTNNAFYDGKTDAMLFVPYTNANLPIAANGGILAHEHFHSLFYKIVIKNQGLTGEASIHDRKQFLKALNVEEDNTDNHRVRVVTDDVPNPQSPQVEESKVKSYYMTTFVRGLNEGLADFWGWMYSGDPDFIASSLPSEKLNRSLKVESNITLTVAAMEQVRSAASLYTQYDKVRFGNYLVGLSYNIGTRYSRLLKRFTDIAAESRGVDSLSMRKEVAKWIIKTLPVFREDFTKTSATGYYAPAKFLENMASVISDMSEKECNFFADSINSTDADFKRICIKDGSYWKLMEGKE
ncbi:MAG: hypothetical protein ACM3MG_14200 [Bacillota bacterium]